jgi:hypothetical protein
MTATGFTREDVRALWREVNDELAGERATTAAASESDDRAVALELLTSELGDRSQALEALALDPATHLDRLKPKLAEHRAAEARAAEEQQAAEYAASPEGRAEKAQAAAQQAEERRRLAAAARELLIEEGEPEDIVRSITDQEALEYAQIEKSDVLSAREEEARILSDPEALAELDRGAAKERLYGAAYHQMTPEARAVEAEIAGVDPADVQQFHRDDIERRFG